MNAYRTATIYGATHKNARAFFAKSEVGKPGACLLRPHRVCRAATSVVMVLFDQHYGRIFTAGKAQRLAFAAIDGGMLQRAQANPDARRG